MDRTLAEVLQYFTLWLCAHGVTPFAEDTGPVRRNSWTTDILGEMVHVSALGEFEPGSVFGETIEGDGSGMPLVDLDFDSCTFSQVGLEKADLSNSAFSDCRFEDCNLAMAEFAKASLNECTFVGCKLVGVNWAAARISTFAPVPLIFERSVLDYGWFVGADLSRCLFAECSLKEVDFTEARLADATMRSCDLTGAKFQATDLRRTNMAGSHDYFFRLDENITAGLVLDRSEAVSLLTAFGIVFE